MRIRHVIEGMYDTQEKEEFIKSISQYVEREIIEHAKHAAEAGCDECAGLVEQLTASEDWSQMEDVIDELVAHLTPEDDGSVV